jgi:protein-S-isoprenylcysteine O-methyltransferase Ste14
MKEHPAGIHLVLARSYSAYLLASIVGLFADLFFPLDFTLPHATQIAVVCIGAGTLLVVWAQYTSRYCANEHHDHHGDSLYFQHGPYRFMRNPTHLGILLMVAGYAVVSKSVIFFAVTLIGYLFSNIFFRNYEFLLRNKYGNIYDAYKKRINKIL